MYSQIAIVCKELIADLYEDFHTYFEDEHMHAIDDALSNMKCGEYHNDPVEFLNTAPIAMLEKIEGGKCIFTKLRFLADKYC